MARILLVDDSDDSRFAVAETVRKLAGHVVDEAAEGPAALERLRQAEYDLVLLDVQMPGMDGFEVCRCLRTDKRTARVPVLFLTATQYQVESRLKGLEVGADDFIVQPVSNQELIARIKAALRVKSLSDEVRRHNAELEGKVRERTRVVEQLADELRAERDALRETFEGSDDALVLLDAAGEVLLANAAGRRLGQTPLASELRALALETAADAAGKRVRSLSDGRRGFVARARSMSGRRVLLSVRDVTEERDNELRRLQSEKLASIGMLAAGVAHEINNPAAFVLGNIEALLGHTRLIEDRLRVVSDPGARASLQELAFEAAAILQESKEGMARIQRIVRDLSLFSHADDDSGAITEINPTVESTLTMLRNELRHRAVVERDLRARQVVRGSPARLSQVFLNLVVNAAQALTEANPQRNRIVVRTFDMGGADGQVAVPPGGAGGAGGSVVFEVSDNGPGIPPEVLPRIFDSFFTTKPPGVGTGLGLPISQGIVRAAGGEITVHSEVGVGTTFRVRLPARPAAPSTRSAAGEREGRAEGYVRRRVLAVDDEALLLKAYRRMLAEVHDVTTALGAKDALRVLDKQRDFDVVLCDLQMPEMSGIELYTEVQRRFPGLAERFVFVTGGAFSQEAKRFLEQAVSCISKPFRIEELLAVIAEKTAAEADRSQPHPEPVIDDPSGEALPAPMRREDTHPVFSAASKSDHAD